MTAAVVAVLAGFVAMVRPSGSLRRGLSWLNERFDPAVQAGLIVCAGALGFAALTWAIWPVYNALTALALISARICWTYPYLVLTGGSSNVSTPCGRPCSASCWCSRSGSGSRG